MDPTTLKIAVGIAAFVVVVLVVRALYRRFSTRDEREADEKVRNASLGGDFRRAGDLQAQRGKYREAARLYVQGGEHARAARALLRLSDERGAAEAFEKASEFPRAAELWRSVGEAARAADCFARSSEREDRIAAAEAYVTAGDYPRAAKLFQEAGEFEKAADAYSRVPKLEPPDLVLTMLENAYLGLARDDARRTRLAGRAGEVGYSLGQHERAARAFDEAGEPARAAAIYEQALKRFNLAAALYFECGDAKSAERVSAAAGGEVAVLEVREARARERGEKELVKQLRHELREARQKLDSDLPPKTRVPTGDTTQAAPYAARDPSRELRNAPPETGARYEILGELGRGGMGVVHRARDRLLDRHVALKFLPADIDPSSPLVAVFRREARAAAALSHPGIVTIYDFGTIDGREFIAMELVEGTTLDHGLQSGPLQVMDGLDVMEKVLDAVAYAHGKGVVHRDLKPSNLMRLKTGGIKVMDFGLAKVWGKNATKATIMGGTPAYMPPEQVLGNTDHRSDVFALGATFYEILTGVLPGTSTEPASSAQRFPSPRERMPAIPARLSDVIMRCLDHDPDLRPSDVPALLAEVKSIKATIISELRAFVKDEPRGDRHASTREKQPEKPQTADAKPKRQAIVEIVETDRRKGR